MLEISLLVVLTVVFSLLQVYMIHLYFNSFTHKKINQPFFIIISFVMMCTMKLLPSDCDTLIKISIFIGALSIIICISFYGTFAQKFYHTIFFSVIMTLSDLCLSIFVSSFPKLFITYNDILVTAIVSSGFNFLSLFLSFVIVKLLIYFKVDVDLDLSGKEYALLSIIPLCSLICILVIDRFKDFNIFMSYTFLLIVNVCIMLLYYKVLKKNFEAQKYVIIKRENEYYRSFLLHQKEIIQFKHDLNNIMLNLDLCLSENMVWKARQQISKLINLGHGSYEKISGCIAVDAILNNKITVCKARHINYETDIQIPYDLHVDSIDISVILGNLLDNAIEAVLRLDQTKERQIDIVIKYVHNKLVVKITNTCKMMESDFSKGIVLSEKEKGRYGIGISSIKDRISKLGGYYDFSYTNTQFCVLAVIPLTDMWGG